MYVKYQHSQVSSQHFNICRQQATVMRMDNGVSLFLHTGELGYDGPLYDGFLHMTDDMLGLGPMHIKYSSYV